MLFSVSSSIFLASPPPTTQPELLQNYHRFGVSGDFFLEKRKKERKKRREKKRKEKKRKEKKKERKKEIMKSFSTHYMIFQKKKKDLCTKIINSFLFSSTYCTIDLLGIFCGSSIQQMLFDKPPKGLRKLILAPWHMPPTFRVV